MMQNPYDGSKKVLTCLALLILWSGMVLGAIAMHMMMAY